MNTGGSTRQFSDDYFDLYVQQDGRMVTWFQLCYDKYGDQKALTWSKAGQLSHARVDEDNEKGQYPMSAILVADGSLDCQSLLSRFKTASRGIDRRVISAVFRVLRNYPKRIR